MEKKNFFQGTIDKYRSDIRSASLNAESFITYSSGKSRKIILPNGVVMRYYGNDKKQAHIEGSFLVPMVYKEIDAYIEKNGVPEHQEVADVQLFNMPKIQGAISDKNKPIMGVDINACYWTTAYHLGYISKELYERGINTCKKAGLLVSIGCLNKRPMVKKYQNGKLVSSYYDDASYVRYSPFYWNIIQKTHDIMIKTYEVLGKNWYMYLTDCLFVDIEKTEDAQKLISDMGYKTKTHLIEYIDFDGSRLTWFDFKDNRKKGIYAVSRDIQSTYDLVQIQRSYPP